MRGKATRWDTAAHRKRPAFAVEEDEVEREAHADGVDARAAWDQQARAGFVAIETAEAEQAGAEANGDRHRQATAGAPR